MSQLTLWPGSAFRRNLIRSSTNFGLSLVTILFTTVFCSSLMPSFGWAQSYNPATAFEQGFTTKHNPDGVWSYGYSSGFTSPITLYDQTVQNGVNGPNAQYWLSASVDNGNSPSAEYNDGPAYNDGNVDFLSNEFLLVSGIGGQYSNLVFTAPADGVYSVMSAFRGAQYGIGTVVGVVANGTVLFNSNVTSVGQLVTFNTAVTLKAGNTLRFSVGPGGGLQNTGLSATITPQTFYTLTNFNGTNGYDAYGSLVQGLDGSFYGTTKGGGASAGGTIFKITSAGNLTTLHNFVGNDGYFPEGNLILATDGNFYGTTYGGGANGYGTVFKITATGILTTLYSFCSQMNCIDGSHPFAGLVQGTDGEFYGTTFHGGANDAISCTFDQIVGCGTVFKITAGGQLTRLYSFCAHAGCTDGASPLANLVQTSNGNFYGTTFYGGTNGIGTIFEITASGKLSTLHSFDGTDGANPEAGLVQANNGKLYGTTYYGGTSGATFAITLGGALTTLHSFQGYPTDGSHPEAGLIQGSDGNLYGTTVFGGTSNACSLGGVIGCGTVFKQSPNGPMSLLHSFDSADGAYPNAGLLQATNGKFYGTTTAGGADGDGTIFVLGVGLGPFIETTPTSGKVGTAVIILGNNLTGSAKVTFNGTAATFSVVSSTEIKTTVPNGATTGKVKVTTPSGTLTSNVNFRVTPTISSFSPTSAPPGTSVVITGESFTGATRVTFGGVKATFTVNSYTKITATVPSGAKTGKISVTTPGGTATSAGTFTVT